MILPALAFVLAASADVPATPTPRTSAPPKRAHHALVYDEASKRVLLTGGSTPRDEGSRFEFFDDVWAFDGTRWTALAPAGQALSGQQLAYDTKRKQVLSFGGFDGSPVGDLRRLEAKAWKPLGKHPEIAAAEPGFVYDVARDRFVAFGGSAGQGQAHGDTWEYDSTSWKKVATDGPPARQAHVMVHDTRRRRTVVFGGMGIPAPGAQQPPLLGDTWEWDGTRWARVDVDAPSARMGSGAAYDSKRGAVVVFGGSDANGFRNDTWSFDGRAWQKLADDGPEARAMGYLAYDKARDRVVLFGGRKGWPDGDLDDTWQWDGKRWTRVP